MGTDGNDGKNVQLKLQNDGNLVLYDDSIALWSTGPNQQACSGVFDSLQIGGKLEEGRWLKSENGKCYVVMQSDGNFVLYRSHDKTAFWETGTTQPGIRPVLSLQDDGNLVIYYQDGAWSMVAWSSGTYGNDGKNVKLKLQNDGNLVLYDDSIALWSTGPNQQACSGPEGHNKCEPYKYLMHPNVSA